jgi:signal transduction histidine kinase
LIGEGVMGTINERQRRFLNIASHEITRVSNLLNHLMQVSRLEHGSIRIDRRPLRPSVFVSDCVSHLKPAAETKGTTLETEMPSEIPEILADPERLQQVLVNLVGNAIKFSPPKSKVKIRLRLNGAKKWVEFSVTDNGTGIPEEEQRFIFDKYYRARGVREHMDGVGLGLSISKHIVEAHGGTMWVDSKEGQGSTFAFSIPTVSGQKIEKPASLNMKHDA